MNENDKMFDKDRIYGYWGVVKAFAAIAAISVLSYKILVTPINFILDFPTLLSLLLAFFSVALSALFYFKATETSNSFYDNTHKFTRDIAQLLAKMESGFGEKLRHLDEGYSSMRDYLQKSGTSNQSSSNMKSEQAKQKIEEEEEQVSKTISERNKLIEELLERAHLDATEKERFVESLKSKEKELEETKSEINRLKNQIRRDKLMSRTDKNLLVDPGFREYVAENIVRRLGKSTVIDGGPRALSEQFRGIADNLQKGFLADLESSGLIDSELDLTRSGFRYLKALANEIWG